MADTGFDLETATSVISAGSRPLRWAAAAIRSDDLVVAHGSHPIVARRLLGLVPAMAEPAGFVPGALTGSPDLEPASW